MRLFLAVAPDEAARYALAETARLVRPLAKGRYDDASLYHITLAFLGDTPPERVPVIREAMQEAAQCGAVSLALGSLGAFGSVLWRGVADDTALNALAQALRHALAAREIPFDTKPFRAHITLARQSSLPPQARALALPGARWTAHEIILYESVQQDGRIRYIPRAEVKLA